jgi:hypothetical protein
VTFSRLIIGLVFVTAALRADPGDDVRAAFDALRHASGYAWETTARQSWREYPERPTPPELAEHTPTVEVQGKEGGGFTEVTLLPSKTALEVPVTALIKSSVEALANTPIGWMTRQEMRDSPRRGETVPIEGKPVKLFRYFSVAAKASNVESPSEELVGLIADIKSFEETPSGIVGHMRTVSAQMLAERGPGAIHSADEIQGTVLFRLHDGNLASYEVKLVSEVPRVGRDPIRSTTRWTTTISSIGSTTVSPPYDVVKRFEQLAKETH